jgi:ribosomal protein S26
MIRDEKEEIVKESNKATEKKERSPEKHIICPQCGALVPYHRRMGHSCFRSHMIELQKDIARFGRAIGAG